MINEILTRTYYGNEVIAWLVAFLIILASVVVGKIVYWISGNVIKKLTKKTKTRLDDILVDMIEEPAVFGITIAGIWFAAKSLTLSESATTFFWNGFQLLIVFDVAWLITRVFDSLYQEYLVPLADKTKSDLDDHLLPIVRRSTNIIVWALAIIIALNNAGYNVGALLAGLGIGGLAFAMAAKDTISNIFGGITIFTDKPFKIGDRVKIAGFDGNIKEIGLRSSRLQTLEGRIVTIPNSKFTDSPIENVTKEPSRKVLMNIGLTYDTTPKNIEKAMKILESISKKNKGINKNYKISFTEFGDSAMNIMYIYYIKKEADILKTKTEINMAILNQFNKAKLDFAFPSQSIYIEKK